MIHLDVPCEKPLLGNLLYYHDLAISEAPHPLHVIFWPQQCHSRRHFCLISPQWMASFSPFWPTQVTAGNLKTTKVLSRHSSSTLNSHFGNLHGEFGGRTDLASLKTSGERSAVGEWWELTLGNLVAKLNTSSTCIAWRHWICAHKWLADGSLQAIHCSTLTIHKLHTSTTHKGRKSRRACAPSESLIRVIFVQRVQAASPRRPHNSSCLRCSTSLTVSSSNSLYPYMLRRRNLPCVINARENFSVLAQY